MGYWGVGICFFINAVSYMAVVIGLLFTKPLLIKKEKKVIGNLIQEIKGGLTYIFETPILIRTLAIILIIGIFIPNFSVLVPVYAKEALRQGEQTFGLLMACMGIGSFFGAMFVATMSKTGPNAMIVKRFPWVASVLMAAIGLMNHFATAGLLLACTGFFFVAFASSANSTMQLNARDDYRGAGHECLHLGIRRLYPFWQHICRVNGRIFGPNGGLYCLWAGFHAASRD